MADHSQSDSACVRLELRHGNGRPTVFAVNGADFVIGSVPGCDLRLTGSNLPPVLAVITRHGERVHIRKLAASLPFLHNGKAFSAAELQTGDLLSLGPITILVAIERGESRLTEVAFSPIPLVPPKPPAAAPTSTRPLPPAVETVRESDAFREELAAAKRELDRRYQERRDRLAGLQQAVDTAARNLQERKRAVDADRTALQLAQKNLERQRLDIEERERRVTEAQEKLARAKLALDEEVQQLDDRTSVVAEREKNLAAREERYRDDLARLARLHDALEQRERQIEAKQADCHRRAEQLQATADEADADRRELNAALSRQREHAEQLLKVKTDLEAREQQLEERTRAVDSQQTMLASLRARLERTRDEVRKEAALLVEQRARQEAAERAILEQTEQLGRTQSSIAVEEQSHASARREFEERNATLQSALAQMQQMKEQLAAEADKQQRRSEELEAQAAELARQAEELKSRAQQLVAFKEQLDSERAALTAQGAARGADEAAHQAADETWERRAGELAAREAQLEDAVRVHEETVAQFGRYHAAFSELRTDVEAQFTTARAELERKASELDRQSAELVERESALRRHVEKLRQVGAAIALEKKAQFTERSHWIAEQAALAAEADSLRTELDAFRRKTAEESAALKQQLPDLELRGEAVLGRLTQAREQLRSHLAELHAYARQSQDDLQALRTQIETEFERLRAQELSVQRDRAEHRLSVTAFRQQLIEWQGRLAEMRQSLVHDGARLEWKQAEVDAAARQIDATTHQLAKQAADLSTQERHVAERRSEIERHLADMREWYREKLRELADSAAGSEKPDDEKARTGGMPDASSSILRLPSAVEELDPGDRQLGHLLQTLELVDSDTLAALLAESRRQRRSLRQVLLGSRDRRAPLLTLYQMALIESGNLDALVLGPVRVVDRLQVTPHETVYRVFDPRRASSALLRHLSEAEVDQGDHAEEFRRSFAAASAVSHANLAATWEVLEINGRPAIVQEWLTGLPASDWPAAAAVPGVWYRLLMQTALGMRAAHDAGLVHGCLEPHSVVLTSVGVVKLLGFGEPAWLSGAAEDRSPASDLTALGAMAARWAALAPRRRGNRPPKPLPAPLAAVLNRLETRSPGSFTTATELLEALEVAGSKLADASDSWDVLLEHVAEFSAEPVAWRKSA